MGKRGSGSFKSAVTADLSTPSNGGISCGLVHESDELHAECFCRWSAGVRGAHVENRAPITVLLALYTLTQQSTPRRPETKRWKDKERHGHVRGARKPV